MNTAEVHGLSKYLVPPPPQHPIDPSRIAVTDPKEIKKIIKRVQKEHKTKKPNFNMKGY